MNGIASFLDPPATFRVQQLWQELEARCGLVGVKGTPFPHFSWQVAEAYNLTQLESILNALVKQTQPLTIHTAGLGLFSGENPVIYISIVKNEPLMRFHSLLWEQMQGVAIRPSLFYSPDQWIPHITLAYNDVTAANLDNVIQYLAFQSFNWEIHIDNLILVAQGEDQPTKMVRFHFGI